MVKPCPQGLGGYTLIGVDVGDGDDTLDTTAVPPRDGGTGSFILTLRGGAGADRMVDGEASALIYPDAGADSVDAGDGSDWIYASNTRPDGADVYDLGDGEEQTIDYRSTTYGVRISLDGRANDGGSGEHDQVLGEGVEYVIGGSGDDVITNPSREPVVVDGRGGDDEISGGDGADVLHGGPGRDRLVASEGLRPDGSRDRVDCGRGTDRRSFAGPEDRVRRCESIREIG
jgi:Ca2+-binding RTX toxin-like protein